MPPEKSRKYLLAAIALLFISQFFKYNSDLFSPGWYSSYTGYYYGGYYYSGETGWQYHGWIGAGLIAAAAYYFYKGQRKLRDYYIVLPVIVLLGFGGSTGGTLGFFSMLIAGYAVYTRWKEVKAAPQPSSGGVAGTQSPLTGETAVRSASSQSDSPQHGPSAASGQQGN